MNAFEVFLNPCNPGQFFACCGFLEMAERLSPGCEGKFVNERTFRVTTDDADPLARVVRAITEAGDIVGPAEDAYAYTKEIKEGKKDGPTRHQSIPLNLLPGTPLQMRLDWWLKPSGAADGRAISLWCGQQVLWAPREAGKKKGQEEEDRRILPGMQADLRKVIAMKGIGSDILDLRAGSTGRIGVDPVSSVEKLDAGFSLNDHKVLSATSPATEIFACIGFQGFRPKSVGRGVFEYTMWEGSLPTIVARAAVGGAFDRGRRYRFAIVKRDKFGSFGKAERCRDVNEEETQNEQYPG